MSERERENATADEGLHSNSFNHKFIQCDVIISETRSLKKL